MPEGIQPSAALNPRAKKAFRRKRSRKGQRVRNDDQGGKEIAICQYQERKLGNHGVLVKQQNSGDKVRDEYYGQNRWDEAINSRHRWSKERHNSTGHELNHSDGERKAALFRCRRQVCQRQRNFIRCFARGRVRLRIAQKANTSLTIVCA